MDNPKLDALRREAIEAAKQCDRDQINYVHRTETMVRYLLALDEQDAKLPALLEEARRYYEQGKFQVSKPTIVTYDTK